MKIPALLLMLNAFSVESSADDAKPSRNLFKSEPVKLRALPAEPLYIQPFQSSFELSATDLTQKLEADTSRFKAMNGRDLVDIPLKSEPPPRAIRIFKILVPKDRAVLGKNPNAPPNKFTR